MTLYKYTKKIHIDSFFTSGKLRIGTLYEYKNIEKHGTVIGDEHEGEKSIYNTVKHEVFNKDSVVPPVINKRIKICADNVTLKNVTVSETINSNDLYIYSTSYKFDKTVMQEFGYDFCFSINDPDKFFKAISETLRYKAIYQGLFECIYQDRYEKYDENGINNIHPALIKDKNYSTQSESRAIWQPITKGSIEPIIITCTKAIKYCSII